MFRALVVLLLFSGVAFAQPKARFARASFRPVTVKDSEWLT